MLRCSFFFLCDLISAAGEPLFLVCVNAVLSFSLYRQTQSAKGEGEEREKKKGKEHTEFGSSVTMGTMATFKTIMRCMPSVQSSFLLEDIVSVQDLRNIAASQFRKHKDVKDPKVNVCTYTNVS